MKLKELTRKYLLLTGATCLSMALFVCPGASLSAQAYSSVTEATIQPRAHDIQYRYKIENGKMYKRLYNYTTQVWIGDWIYVCDYPG